MSGADPSVSIDRVRRSIGVCPQHDSLWPQLTVAEHLLIFSRIRGKGWGGGWSAAHAEAESAMRNVGLHDAAHLKSIECSGGMRRRLSVAISALGNPSVLLLDEPTTGMDPLNRQEAWKVISTVSQGRCVILTSHAMEEVDALCSRVAILAEGQLKAFDAPVNMKQTIGGGGYQLQVTATSAAAIPEIMSRLKPLCGGLLFGQSRDCVFWMELGGGEAVVRVLQALDAMKECSSNIDQIASSAKEIEIKKQHRPSLPQKPLVLTYDIGTTSLEDVFFRITENSHFEPGKSRDSSVESHDVAVSAVNSATVPSPRPFTAVFCKNTTLQLRRMGTNACQVMTPICVLLLLYLLQQVIVSVSPPGSMLPTAINTFPVPFNFNILALQKSQGHTGQTHDATCIQSFKTFTDSDELDALIGACNSSSLEGQGFMGFLGPRAPCHLIKDGEPDLYVPFTQPQPTHDWETVWSQTYSDLLILNDQPFKSLEDNPDALNVSDAILHFHELSPRPSLNSAVPSSPPRINVTMAINDLEMAVYHRPNNFSRIYGRKAPQFFGQSEVLLLPFARLNMLEFLTSSMQLWALPPSISLEPPPIPSTLQAMPYTDFSDLLVAVEAFGLVLYPICVSLQLPVYLFLFVNEKETKLKAFASAMGLTKFVFWSTNYVFCLIMYTVVVTAFVVGANVIGLRLWTHTPLLILVIMLGGWGLSLVSVAAFLQSFLSNTRSASIVGYSVSLFGAAVGIVVAIGIYFEDDKVMPAFWLVWPQFALTRALFLMDTACIKRLVCFSPQDLLSGEFASCVWSMYASAFVYSAAAWMLDSANMSFFHGFSTIVERLFKRNQQKSKQNPGESMHQSLLNADQMSLSDLEPGHVGHVQDSDVLQECSRVKEHLNSLTSPASSNAPPLIVNGLRKVYDSRQSVAVDKLTLAVGAGECFGLLGPNGAGKSTTVGVLMGLMPVSAGDALVAGYSVSKQLSDVQQNIGICPQHSVFWETLSALENILFFIRLKGSTHSRSEDVVLACDCLHEVRSAFPSMKLPLLL